MYLAGSAHFLSDSCNFYNLMEICMWIHTAAGEKALIVLNIFFHFTKAVWRLDRICSALSVNQALFLLPFSS